MAINNVNNDPGAQLDAALAAANNLANSGNVTQAQVNQVTQQLDKAQEAQALATLKEKDRHDGIMSEISAAMQSKDSV